MAAAAPMSSRARRMLRAGLQLEQLGELMSAPHGRVRRPCGALVSSHSSKSFELEMLNSSTAPFNVETKTCRRRRMRLFEDASASGCQPRSPHGTHELRCRLAFELRLPSLPSLSAS